LSLKKKSTGKSDIDELEQEKKKKITKRFSLNHKEKKQKTT
jgi:hypothetical protein